MADESIKDVKVFTGHTEMTLEDVAIIQPGLGRIMPEIGARTWKLYYAAEAKNWPLARFQAKEAKKLMELCMITRPKYEENLTEFLTEKWEPILKAIEEQDWSGFEKAFHEAVDAGNAYHELRDKPYIKWRLPASPPPDLDLTPRKSG